MSPFIPGPGGVPEPSPFGFLSWDNWSSIATVFSVFVASGLIPLSIYLGKKVKAMRDFNTKKKNNNIKEIATKVSDALEDKLNKKIEQQSLAIESVAKCLSDISEKMGSQDKQNKDILTTLRTLSSDFHHYKDNQVTVNAKVDYIDQIFRNVITFNGNKPTENNNNDSS
ncbi:MAG: hypothetical protein R2685_07870 [Candidatus Nitrosocosmicus sp.]|nr:hypothetical protein [Candidatus Nitrosocosmicus sp.]